MVSHENRTIWLKVLGVKIKYFKKIPISWLHHFFAPLYSADWKSMSYVGQMGDFGVSRNWVGIVLNNFGSVDNGGTRWERRRYLSERPLLASRKISTGRMKSLLHLSLAFSLGWTLKYVDWNLHLYWLLSPFSQAERENKLGAGKWGDVLFLLF